MKKLSIIVLSVFLIIGWFVSCSSDAVDELFKEKNSTYTVTFVMQGHGTQIDPQTNVASSSTISAPAAPTATGYTFGGWYKEAECTTAWDFDNDTVTANTTLYAKWTAIPLTNHSVTFNLNGATGIVAPDPQTVVSGGKATEPTALTFINHTLEGWYKTKNADGTLSDKWDFDNPVTADMTLYANWERSIESILSTIPAFPKSNSDIPINAWANNSNQDIKAYMVPAYFYMPSSLCFSDSSKTTDKELLQIFQNMTKIENVYTYSNEQQKYTITFNMTNEDKLESIVVTALDDASQDIRDVAGTYTAPNEPVCIITLNPNGGTGGSTTATVTNGATGTSVITPPTKTGCTLEGWFTSATGGDKVLDPDGSLLYGAESYTAPNDPPTWDRTEPATLYAHWTEWSTIADVLATVEGGFPENESKEVPENAWVNDDNDNVYVHNNLLLTFNNSKIVQLTTEITKTKDGYTAAPSGANLTFKMENGRLISIEYTATNDKKEYDGTYKRPNQ